MCLNADDLDSRLFYAFLVEGTRRYYKYRDSMTEEDFDKIAIEKEVRDIIECVDFMLGHMFHG